MIKELEILLDPHDQLPVRKTMTQFPNILNTKWVFDHFIFEERD